MSTRVLECSSKGDKRFSARFARVSVFGESNTIEVLYQGCKRSANGGKVPKGAKPNHMVVNGVKLDVSYLTPFYNWMWVKYLDTYPQFVKDLKKYDDYNDSFKGNSINCQADSIRAYVKDRNALVLSPVDFLVRVGDDLSILDTITK